MALRASRTAIFIAASITAISTVLLGHHWVSGSDATVVGQAISRDGFAVEVRDTAWVPMDHVEDGQGGFLMPDQMMPGAPTGNQVRLSISVILSNTRARPAEFSLADDFTLTGGLQAEPLRLHADTVGDLHRLGGNTALNATLFFDVETAPGQPLPPLYLTWQRGRDTLSIPLPEPGQAPQHVH